MYKIFDEFEFRSLQYHSAPRLIMMKPSSWKLFEVFHFTAKRKWCDTPEKKVVITAS